MNVLIEFYGELYIFLYFVICFWRVNVYLVIWFILWVMLDNLISVLILKVSVLSWLYYYVVEFIIVIIYVLMIIKNLWEIVVGYELLLIFFDCLYVVFYFDILLGVIIYIYLFVFRWN